MKRAWLWFIKNTLNRATMRSARGARGRFSIIRHVGRKSGKTFESVVILAEVPQGFVAELTYGDQVNWYRNLVAAHGGEVIHHGQTYRIDAITTITDAEGYKAYGPPEEYILKFLHRHDFRLLHVAGR